MIGFDIDLTDLERQFGSLERTIGNPSELASDLETDAEVLARERIDFILYSTPERGYERSGLLRESLKASSRVTANGLEIKLESGPGFKGLRYGAANEGGTLGSRQDLDSILEAARGSSDPLSMGAYARGESGLEARPFLLPTVAALEDELPMRVYDLIAEAAR